MSVRWWYGLTVVGLVLGLVVVVWSVVDFKAGALVAGMIAMSVAVIAGDRICARK